jgi:HTH-type transcriptional regulator/antitoxin HigA
MSLENSNENDWSDFVHSTRPKTVASLEIIERFKAFREFFQRLPKKELVNRGWLRTPDDLSSLASVFFDLPASQNPTLFRKSATANESMLLMWLSQVRATAEYSCILEPLPTFKSLGKSDLRKFAHLSPDPKLIKTLPATLSEFGICLIYLPALPGMKADGAVFRLSSGHPVVALSLRFSRLDYFWFTLMHELAHVVLHADKLGNPIFVDVETEDEAVMEKATNKLAKESFVERSSWRNCEPKYQSGDNAVINYARQQGIHPSIVAGLLRRETGNYSRYSAIINEYDVRQIIHSS